MFISRFSTRFRYYSLLPGDRLPPWPPPYPIVSVGEEKIDLLRGGIETLGAPQALGGFLVAVLVLSPEGLAAVKAALANQLQRTMNMLSAPPLQPSA